MAEFPEWADEVRRKALDRVKSQKETDDQDDDHDKAAAMATAMGKHLKCEKILMLSTETPDSAHLEDSVANAVKELTMELRRVLSDAASSHTQMAAFKVQMDRMERAQLTTQTQVAAIQQSTAFPGKVGKTKLIVPEIER